MAGLDKLTPQILRPKAAPTDTFVRPGEGQLGQLARGLSEFAPSLSRYSSVIAAERGEKEKIEGQNQAREFVESHKTYKEAVEAGLIEKHHSPFFRLGAYETFGRASAYRYQEDFRSAFAQSDVAESTTPGDFDSFEGEHRAKWMKENLGEKVDPYFANAFGSSADNLMNEERHNFSSGAASRLTKQTGEAYHAEVHSIVKEGFEQHASAEEVAALIHLAMERQLAAHMGKSVVNELTAQAITSAAKRVNDASVLDYMDKIKVGSGVMSGTGYGTKLREDAENEIASVNQNRHVAHAQEEEQQKKVAIEAVTADLVTTLSGAPSPTTVDLKPFITRAVKAGDADSATKFIGIQKAMADREYLDVPAVVQRLTIGAYNGSTSLGQLDSALAAKSITFSTFKSLAEEVKQREKEGTSKTDMKASSLERIRRRVRGLFVSEYGDSQQSEKLRAEIAGTQAVSNYIAWRKTPEGQKGGPEQEEKWVAGEATRLFGTVSAPTVVSDPENQEIIHLNAGPKPVDPKKHPVAPEPVILQLQSEFRAGKLSPGSIRVLKAHGIAPDAASIEKFLQDQAKHIGSNP